MRLAPVLGCLLLLPGCGGSARVQSVDSGGGPLDLAVGFLEDSGPGGGGGCGLGAPCTQGQRCFEERCIADNGTCQSNDECQNDTWCDCTGGGGGDAGPCVDGVCIPFGYPPAPLLDPDCAQPGFTPDKFVAPMVRCKHPGTTTLSSTLVADLDGDKKPEIIYVSYHNGFTALHGKDCSVYFDLQFTFAGPGQSQLAVADLDNDKVPEIVGIDQSNFVVVFDNKGNVLARSPTPAGAISWGAPAIADVDNKAPPEIIVGGQVTRYVKGNNMLTVLFTNSPKAPQFGPVSIAADLDGDNKPEVIAGAAIYDGVTGADKTPPALANLPPAFAAIGDFNQDKKPDIVLVMSGTLAVAIYDYANKKFLFGPVTLPAMQGGPPTVADFDGDGKPEFGTAAMDAFYVMKPSCMVKNGIPPKPCDQGSNLGILWQKKTQDHSSGVTGSSVFDFNGDGAAEVVYRDECWLRVYDGKTGRTVFAATVTSVTGYELPVVADVDNDGHADIVVCSDQNNPGICPQVAEADTGTPWGGATSGVMVLRDPKNRWMPSRSVWNQHSYHITNVNDNLSIPTIEKASWLTYNNYRQNVQGSGSKPLSVPDYTGAAPGNVDNTPDSCMSHWTLRAQLCNRGTAASNPGITGAFYQSDPRVGQPAPICVTPPTADSIGPGTCVEVSCDWQNPPSGLVDLYFRANDDGTSKNVVPECHNGNDILFMPRASCVKIG